MPLTFNSPRASPFQRPSPPGSPTPAMNRPTTPTHASPGRGANHTPTTSPSKLKQSYTAEDAASEDLHPSSPTPTTRPFVRSSTEPPPANYHSPSKSSVIQSPTRSSVPLPSSQALDTTLLSRLPQPLVHTLRETFAVLDTNSDNILTPSDIVETFQSLSLPPPTPAEMSQFFPSGSQSISLPVFLNTLAGLLTRLSSTTELLNAFSAFDENDSGEIDVEELRNAVLNTAPDSEGGDGRAISARDFEKSMEGWTGRRAFTGGRGLGGLKNLGGGAGNGKKGDVFRYHEFVTSIMSGGFSAEAGAEPKSVAA